MNTKKRIVNSTILQTNYNIHKPRKIINIRKNINYIKVLRIALSSCIAILIASFVGLKYSSSAGIIAFLSTQDTKKETITDIIIRCLSYLLAVVLSFITFHILGYNTYAFGVFMFLIVTISYYFDWASVLSSSAVVSTHFLMDGALTGSLFINEMLLLLIGIGSTMIMNLFVSNNTKVIKNDMTRIENEFQATFIEMSKYIKLIDRTEYDIARLNALRLHLDESYERAINNKNNEFFSDSNYYLDYMTARIEQFESMQRVVDSMHSLTQVPFMALELSDFCNKISQSVHWRNNTLYLLEEHKNLYKAFDNFPIPQSREEFLNLSHLHDILVELEYYLYTKHVFVSSLSQKQLNRFWKEGNL